MGEESCSIRQGIDTRAPKARGGGEGCRYLRENQDTMDTIFEIAQYVAAASCLGMGILLITAGPYALGRMVGMREADASLAELSTIDKLRFRMRMAELEVRGAQQALAKARGEDR